MFEGNTLMVPNETDGYQCLFPLNALIKRNIQWNSDQRKTTDNSFSRPIWDITIPGKSLPRHTKVFPNCIDFFLKKYFPLLLSIVYYFFVVLTSFQDLLLWIIQIQCSEYKNKHLNIFLYIEVFFIIDYNITHLLTSNTSYKHPPLNWQKFLIIIIFGIICRPPGSI